MIHGQLDLGLIQISIALTGLAKSLDVYGNSLASYHKSGKVLA